MPKIPALAAAAVLLVAVLLVWTQCGRSNTWPLRNDPPARGTTIVAFGDSLTAGFGAAEGEDFPALLSRSLGVPIINRGVPGETTADALRRVDQVLADDPRVVIVFLGGNDLLRRTGREPMLANLRRIVEQLQDAGVFVVLVGLEGPSLLGGGGLDRAYRDLARETGALHVPNAMAGILGNTSLMSDQIHPNAEGYRRMAEHIEHHAGRFMR